MYNLFIETLKTKTNPEHILLSDFDMFTIIELIEAFCGWNGSGSVVFLVSSFVFVQYDYVWRTNKKNYEIQKKSNP